MPETKNAEQEVQKNIADKKFDALKEFVEERKINGVQFLEGNGLNKILRSNLLIAGQQLPMFVVVNETIYSFVQVHLATVDASQAEKCMLYLNELNERFSMLKYNINSNGNVVITCSIPSLDDNFSPALIIMLVDQVKMHLETHYPELMKRIWEK